MANKRTLSEAISLSPETQAFIRGVDEKTPSKSLDGERTADTKTIDLDNRDHGSRRDPDSELARPSPRRQRQRPAESIPSVNDVLDEVLIPLTTRLPHRLVQSLRRLCLEQRLKHAKPDSIQEVVEVALEEWLAKRLR